MTTRLGLATTKTSGCGENGQTTSGFSGVEDHPPVLMEMASVVGSAGTACLRLRGFLATSSSLPASSSAAGGGGGGGRSVSIYRRSGFVVRAKVEPSEKSVEVMRKFSEQYARRSGTYFCVDKGVTAVVIKGLAEHRDSVGAPLCPCRHYDDKAAEVGQGFWNCPCVPMRERKECHCMLFLTPDNDFAGKEQAISLDEIKETTSNL